MADERLVQLYWDDIRSNETRRTTGLAFTFIAGRIEGRVEVALGLNLSPQPTDDEFRRTLGDLSAVLSAAAAGRSRIFRHPHQTAGEPESP
jgi:hypothetical protein